MKKWKQKGRNEKEDLTGTWRGGNYHKLYIINN